MTVRDRHRAADRTATEKNKVIHLDGRRRWRLGAERATPKKKPRLLPVVVEPVAIEVDAAIDLVVRDVHIRVRPGTDVRYVAALIDAVRAC